MPEDSFSHGATYLMMILFLRNRFSVFFYLQVGFHSGRNGSVYNIDVSGTDAVINVSRTSNVNFPGRWVFRIDGPSIDDLGCTTDSKLAILCRKDDTTLHFLFLQKSYVVRTH